MAIDIGAQPYGNWSAATRRMGYQRTAFGDREVLDNFQKHSYPLGIIPTSMPNASSTRRGLPHHYVRFGRAIMQQPHRTAIQIFDQKTVDMLRDEYRIPVTGGSGYDRRAAKLELDAEKLKQTIDEYNAARLRT